GDVQRSALMIADLAILPCGPTASDVWALSSSLELIRSARALRIAHGLRGHHAQATPHRARQGGPSSAREVGLDGAAQRVVLSRRLSRSAGGRVRSDPSPPRRGRLRSAGTIRRTGEAGPCRRKEWVFPC